MKKRLLCLLLSITLLLSIPISANAARVSDFTDVKKTSWYYNAVDYATKNNLFKGTTATTFSPNQAMTRAMFVTVLGRMAGVAETYGSGSSSPFSDVKATSYYFPFALWCNEKSIVNGVGNGKFSPNLSITRQDMAVILFRYAQNAKLNTSSTSSKYAAFPDTWNVSGYAVNALKWATTHGIINGTEGRLDPKGKATRAQVAQILMNFSGLTGETGTTPTPSNPFENLDAKGRPTGKSAVDAKGGYFDYDISNKIMDQIDAYRAAIGVSPLAYHLYMQNCTDIRTKELATLFSHDRPDGSSCFTVGKNLNAENIAYVSMRADNATALAEGWYNSPGHKNNLLNANYKTASVSCYVINGKVYSTHLFSASAPSAFN